LDRASAVEQGSGAQALGDFMRFAGGSLGAIIIAELLEVLGVVKQVVSEVVGGSVLRRPVMAAQRVSRRRIARARRPDYAVPDSAGHRSARGATAVAGAALRVISSCRACLHVRVAGESGHAHPQRFGVSSQTGLVHGFPGAAASPGRA